MSERQHPGDIQLLNSSLDLSVDQALKDHIRQCPRCQRAVRALVRERESFDQSVRPEGDLAELLERRRRSEGIFSGRLAWVPAAGLVAILIVGLSVYFSFGPSGTRTKGSLGVNVYVSRDERVVRADEDFRFRASDRVRLGVVSPLPVRITVLAKGRQGLSPISDLSRIAIVPGRENILPGSLSFDCDRGSETVQLRIFETQDADDFRVRTIVFQCERP